MIIKIKRKVDTGKSILTEENVIEEYERLKAKPYLTAKETMRLHRIEKYGDQAIGQHKFVNFKNQPSKPMTLKEFDELTRKQDEKNVDKVIEEIFSGANLIEACKKFDIKPRFFFETLEKPEYADVKDRFLDARTTLAEYYLYRREQLEKDLLDKKIDPQTYSTLSNDYKYLAAKLAPQAYGDRIQVDTNIKKTNTVEVINSEKIKELNNLLTSNIVDAEFEEEK